MVAVFKTFIIISIAEEKILEKTLLENDLVIDVYLMHWYGILKNNKAVAFLQKLVILI